MNINSNDYIGYEYKELQLESDKVSLHIDCYCNFGWEIDENRSMTVEPQAGKAEKVHVYLKRNRKIMNKAELTRLQRNFEDCLKQIEALETSKTSKALAVAIGIGILGTMFIAGSTFAVVGNPPIIWHCVILAIPGFAGWVLPYFVYRKIVKQRTEVVTLLIEDKYDEIYAICEKGNRLLGGEN